MRFPDLPRVAALLLAVSLPLHAAEDAESVRNGVLSSLRARFPALAPADFVAGSAAFDPARQSEAAANRPAPGASETIEAGRRLWTRKFTDGRSLAGCFPNGGRRIAAAYPQYDRRLKRLVSLETAVNQCLKTHGQPLFEASDPATMGAVLAYVRSLAEGQKVAVRTGSVPAEERFEEGRRLYFARMGQQNYSCASCHVNHAGNYFGDSAIPAAVGSAAAWPFIREGRPVTLQMRIRECLDRMGAAPFPAGSDELAHLEYFLAYLSNGIAIRPNAWRPR
jgi:L-cysteine S-thiosulfotransferase